MSVADEIPAIFLDKISPRALETIQKCKDFVNDYCLPADTIYHGQVSEDPQKRWATTPPVLDRLKEKARLLGLWNLFLSKQYAEGGGYTNLEYGIMAEYLGRSFTAPMATNMASPDTGNMEILARYGTAEQKRTWLQPLLDGQIRSAFLMTEKGTSSSNALNIACSARLNGRGNYVLNGVKWFASGAGDPHCSVWLVMCKTGDHKDNVYRNHSVLVVDAKRALATGKARLVRPLSVFGYDDAPHGHCEVVFEDFEIPDDARDHAVLHREGAGFEVIQSRLGPGRIHHCMRCIGVGEIALMRVVHRANHRLIFGRPLKDRESFLTAYAQFKIDIERCRLLVLNAAHKIDVGGPKSAMREIAVAKIETPRTILKILDWGIQMYGAEGVSQDTELARSYALNRTLRIADGPDEAHLGQLARTAAKRFSEADDFFERVESQRAVVAKM
ncbi:putative acyl-CoA dehydrogenase [Metschnikowia bicuspidata var. bicuspidata NRRL YB-4993]|uniref:Putative acyl-CoA dehydrogenase n=1 Tax=Metschnikowia bicuspidata var. bicuspidata NRRL YB-4993 TaxID=869754 RepID=A0A1A0HFB2_9ASCO|nr:putative acyl-CoA dehydrogenase [Metschnikowia bicuspidata var. bicuspidata NRRL YB-4993]OBA22829.1 putative acyl-CoA dehydrogenase [Metschnikowia bicuspidata var. bicuspidata NRRL YB-4993]